MRIHILGSLAGTEPMPGRNHTSLVCECGEKLYFFDAGEACGRTAYLMGLDLLRVRSITISHTHMDHVGGLGNLLWYIRKLTKLGKGLPVDGKIDIYIPELASWEGILTMLRHTESGFACDFAINPHPVADGLLFDDGLRVTASHTRHLGIPKDGEWRAFGYRMEGEGKSVVFSGDIGDYTDLDPLIGDGCDLLLVETGHMSIDGVYEYTRDKRIGKVVFIHNGREILNYPAESEAKVARLFGERGMIGCDAMTIEV